MAVLRNLFPEKLTPESERSKVKRKRTEPSHLHGYTVHQGYQTFSSPTNAHVEFIKTKLKLGRLLQHVSVYKETIIREPVSA